MDSHGKPWLVSVSGNTRHPWLALNGNCWRPARQVLDTETSSCDFRIVCAGRHHASRFITGDVQHAVRDHLCSPCGISLWRALESGPVRFCCEGTSVLQGGFASSVSGKKTCGVHRRCGSHPARSRSPRKRARENMGGHSTSASMLGFCPSLDAVVHLRDEQKCGRCTGSPSTVAHSTQHCHRDLAFSQRNGDTETILNHPMTTCARHTLPRIHNEMLPCEERPMNTVSQ